jgi:DNA-binding transcriptional LysR family regulator
MQLSEVNLPIDILRAYLTVIDLGGYTRAANALHRSQPAVSLQIKRLEDMLQKKLIVFQGRALTLTEDGDTLAVYARQLLRLNDEAVAKLSSRRMQGSLRIGLPTDFAVAFLQEAISEFLRENDQVTVEITCGLSHVILDQLHRNELDIVVGLQSQGKNPYLVRSWQEQPIWAGSRLNDLRNLHPVPLATHPEGCEYRRRMFAALRSGGREWRIAYTSPAIGGLQRAVSVGLGISALTRKTLLPDMVVLRPEDGFPPLEDISIGLFYKHFHLSNAGLELVNCLMTSLTDATAPIS